MEENNKNTKGFVKFLSEKGFYIVLFICAAVIGVCAWLLWFSAKNGSPDDSAAMMPDYTKTEIEIPAADKASDNFSDTESIGNRDSDSVSVGSWDDEYAEETEASTEEQDAEAISEAEAEPEAAATSTNEPESMATVRPVSGDISVGYAADELIYSKTMADWRTHDGIDIESSVGTKVKSIADGVVSDIYDDDMLGTTVVIDHENGLVSIYSNLAETPTVTKGSSVEMGEVIGSVGTTALLETADAAHLHFSMTLDGESVNPSDYL